MSPSTIAPPTPDLLLNGILDLTRETLAATSEAGVADSIVRVAARLVGADQGTLGLVRHGEVITVASLVPARAPVGSHFPVGFGVAGWVAATGRPAEIEDVREDRRYVALPYPEVRSFVAVPIEIDGQLIGVLSLAAWRPGAFPPQTADALKPLSQHAGLLLRHAAVDQELRERLQRVETSLQENLAESLHELKAPLHAAAGFIELMAAEQAGPLTDQQRDFLGMAQAECERLKDAIATLVEVGASAAQRPLELQAVAPAELVSAAIHRMRGQAMSRGVQLVLELDPDARPVQVDRAAILQVLSNLVQNALRVVESGSEIVLAATSVPNWTCFMVADRGPGLPEGQLEALFERYRQGPGREQERAAGEVGLGLPLSRRIIEQHQGVIWAENRAGGGSRFCFALPTVSTAETSVNGTAETSVNGATE